MDIIIRNYEPSDWEKIKEIYLQGITTKNATFELSVPERGEWEMRHPSCCRLVAEVNEEVAGWAALSPVSSREAYIGVAEVSIYVAYSNSGKGIGKMLLQKLVTESENNGYWTLQASIFPENNVSIALHKTCGFREVGRREKIGKMNGIWRDTILFERRAKLRGTES